MTADYDPLAREFQRNPYPTLARLRSEDPVHRREVDGECVWLLTRYADCVAVLRDPRCSAERFPTEWLEQMAAEPESPFGQMAQATLGMMLLKDPPDHTRLRTLVNKAFTPRRVEALRARLQKVVDDLLDAVRDRGEMDVIADLGAPLPLIAIAELLGLPTSDQAQLKVWSDRFVTFIDGTTREAGLEEAAVATRELRLYLSRFVELRREDPRDDLLSGLIQAHEAGDQLTEEELYATVILLLAAGHETTTNLIGNGILGLLENPGELRKLRGSPALLRPAVEELLRYDSPVQITSRRPKVDLRIDGSTIPAGEEINTSLGAANRDPEVFPHPDRLDLARGDTRHLSFGLGVHFCLGTALARLEGQLAIGSVVERMPELALATDKLEWRPGIVLRGLEALPVHF